MYSIAFSVAYIGTAYHGWQYQPDVPSVQDELQSAASRIADEPVHIAAAGRTDRGVHASAQIAGFRTSTHRDLAVWHRGLNGLTPPDIQVNWVQLVDESFHPRYGAVSREYTYLFADPSEPDVLGYDRTWMLTTRLDADLMHRAAQILVGEQDFSAFRGAGCQSTTPMRRVNSCQVTRRGNVVVMTIEANAFVLHMVRNIATGLVEASLAEDTDHVHQLLRSKDRTLLGATAPAAGLYFTGVEYSGYQFPTALKPTLVSLS